MNRTATAFAALAIAGSLALTACGGGDDDSSDAAATEAPGAGFNDADVLFAQSMIPHHEQAIEMAEIALDPAIGAGPEVLDLASRIQAAQDPEIKLMTGWLTAWGEPVQMDTSDGHDMSSMEGMMSADDMGALGAMNGTAFDQMWMQMMIAHHEGAIAMATDVRTDGSDPNVASLADAIIAAQQAEIDEMNGLLAG